MGIAIIRFVNTVDSKKGVPQRQLTVRVLDSAIMHLMLAGMESFHVRLWGKNVIEDRKPVETAGLVLGYFATTEGMDYIVVEHISTDSYAERTSNDVALNDKVTDVKRNVIQRRWLKLR